MTELQSLLKAIDDDLGDPADWQAPVEFPDSLALCALNSTYSLRAGSASVTNVLTLYRAMRPTADTDSGPDLLRVMDEAGGPEVFAHGVLRNGSKLPGTTRLRTIGIHEGLTKLAAPGIGVTTAAQLREVTGEAKVRKAWKSVHGFGCQAWSFLLMNAGVETEMKPDVMLHGYVGRAIGNDGQVSDQGQRSWSWLLQANSESRRGAWTGPSGGTRVPTGVESLFKGPGRLHEEFRIVEARSPSAVSRQVDTVSTAWVSRYGARHPRLTSARAPRVGSNTSSSEASGSIQRFCTPR